MQEVAKQHRRWVANYFGEKVNELHYHLVNIVNACEESLHLFAVGQPTSKANREAVVYGFSSFVNVIQTLKDAAKTITGQRVPWSEINRVPHGEFMRNARNAATHDGNPIISAWADGRYFVPMKIVRLDDNNKLIEIPAPREDICTLCLEFAAGFSKLLRKTLQDKGMITDIQGASFSITELDDAFANSIVIPEFAKQLFAENRTEIASQLPSIQHDPMAHAIGLLDNLIGYCDSIQKR